jgi:hypothetical protein
MNRHFAAITATLILVQPIVTTMAIALLNISIEIIIGIVLWLQIKQVPERAIFPSSDSG